MPVTTVLLTEDAVDEFLQSHGLQSGSHELETVLLQLHGTVGSNRPCAMLITQVDGKKRLIKVSLDTLESVTKSLRGAVEAAGGAGPPVQPASLYVAQVAQLFEVLGAKNGRDVLAWLCSPHSLLDFVAPIDVIAQGHGEAVLNLIAGPKS